MGRRLRSPPKESDAFLFFTERAPKDSFLEYGELRGEWQKITAEVLAWWIERYPGTRPAAWWRFEANEGRKQLGGNGTIYSSFEP